MPHTHTHPSVAGELLLKIDYFIDYFGGPLDKGEEVEKITKPNTGPKPDCLDCVTLGKCITFLELEFLIYKIGELGYNVISGLPS